MTSGVITLRFNMDSPEQREEYQACFNGPNYKRTIEDFFGWLRTELKYHDRTKLSTEEVRVKLAELLKENVNAE